MSDSLYCYIHSFGKIRSVPFWKNLSLHSIIVAIILFLIGFPIGPSKEKQDEILDKTDRIEKLIEEMRLTEKIEYANLLSRYTSGFILFATDYNGLIKPNDSNLLVDYILDWDNVKIVFLENNEISILLPDITYAPQDRSAHQKFIDIVTKIPRGAPGSVYKAPIFSSVMPDNIFIEILNYTQEGIILCFGFKKKNI